MENINELTHEESILNFHRAYAKRDYVKAVAFLDRAIDTCTCIKTIENLGIMHNETSSKIKRRKSKLWQFANGIPITENQPT